MSGIKGFLIDLDGVMYTGDTPVLGADEAINFLKENGFSFRFVSNTTRKCRHTIAERLLKMGLEIPETHIFTPPIAAVAYMKKTGKRNFRLLVTGDVIEDFPKEHHESQDKGSDLVILGDAGDEITYASLNSAFRDLMDGADLIALERDRYWMATHGLSLSAGPFVAALEFATGKNAILMGKPSQEFFDLALKDMGLRPDQAVMIGDDIHTDVGGAHGAGLRGILVRTGKFREDLVKKSTIRPDLTIDSIAEIGNIVDAAHHNHWERVT
ncbi:MAG: TIGR01458 family HAD-type hydrolase [Methanoregula sp.]|nr:TIGR01458 family HAD-type hydrolase [Methanoregula sp.]